MSTGRGALLRVAAAGGATLLALLYVTGWSLPPWRGWRPRDGLEIAVASFRESQGVLVEDVFPVTGELRFAGSVSRPCYLIVFTIGATGAAFRLGGKPEDGPAPVGPGAFRVPGGFSLDPTPTGTRLWAVCGPADLRYPALLAAAQKDLQARGSGAQALEQADRLEGLPAGTLQSTRLFRWGF